MTIAYLTFFRDHDLGGDVKVEVHGTVRPGCGIGYSRAGEAIDPPDGPSVADIEFWLDGQPWLPVEPGDYLPLAEDALIEAWEEGRQDLWRGDE